MTSSWWERYSDPYDYEKKTSGKVSGGRRSIASGALFGDFDVRGESILIDNKRVAKGKTYRIDYRDFKKVEDKATVHQMPAMFINFHEPGVSLAVVREKDLLALLELVKELTQED